MKIFLDLVLLAVLVLFVVLGARKGFVKALLDGFSTLISGVLAYRFAEPVSQYAYDAFVRNMLKNRISNTLSSTVNNYNTVSEKVEVLITKIPESAVTFSEKLGFNVTEVLESVVRANSDKDVLIDAIMVDIIDKIMMPLVETVTFVALLILFAIALTIVVKMLTSIINKLPVLKESDKILGGILGVFKGIIVIFVVCAILMFMADSSQNQEFIEIVTSSKILEFVNNNNPLLVIFN
ncbi:MAG: CvpA family protein [Clostridia bacterium]|nr:CvpA family protein [Clostridia bacterium]